MYFIMVPDVSIQTEMFLAQDWWIEFDSIGNFRRLIDRLNYFYYKKDSLEERISFL